MNITVTHTLAPEVMALIQGALGFAGLAKAATTSSKQIANANAVVQQQTSTAETALPAEQETTDPKVTVEQVRLAVSEKKDTHKTQIKALLSEFGVASVSALLPIDRVAFLEKIKAW